MSPVARGAGTVAHAAENLETAYPGLQELIRRMYASIDSGDPPPVTAAETRAVAVARDAILASPRG